MQLEFRNRLNSYPGRETLVEFFKLVCKKTSDNFIQYSESLKKKKFDSEHGFIYGEKQDASFLAPALHSVSNGLYLMEESAERLVKSRTGSRETTSSTGRVDYWVMYEDSVFLMEVKHGWVRYHPKRDEYKVFANSRNEFTKAWEQLESIKNKRNWRTRDHLFGIAFQISPVFTSDSVGDIDFQDSIDGLWRKSASFDVNIGGFLKIDPEDQVEAYWDNDVTGRYLSVAFWGRAKKISRGGRK
jgi:hypothetical protein